MKVTFDAALRRRETRQYLKFFLAVFFIMAAGIAASWFIRPDVARLSKENPRKTALMKYREAEAQKQGGKAAMNQRWLPLSQVSEYLVKAVLIAEDDKFWQHNGFDFQAIGEAIEEDIREGRFSRGASTITQQLAKNLYLSPSKSPPRKLREAVLAWRIERALSKKRILEIYLNVAEWGEGVYGIEAASMHYYGKHASELAPEEAARLAAVLPNPRRYSPASGSRYVENRSEIIYRVMAKRGIVAVEEEEDDESSGAPPAIENAPMPDVYLSED